jgi:zinc transport system substrate-binding protein
MMTALEFLFDRELAMIDSIKNIVFVSVVMLFFVPRAMADGKLPVFVTIAPQKYFVQQIGKDLVDVHTMVPPGADPHTYEPKPRQMVAISKAKLYFAVGIEFEEAHLKKITATNPNLEVIHTDHGIEKLAMAAHHHDNPAEEPHEADHDHKETGHHVKAIHDRDPHHDTGLDPHIWLSPPLVKIQARTIVAALQASDPAHRSVYQAYFQEFAAKIDQLDAELKQIFAGKTGLRFMVFHPSWGYFAHAYGLKQVPIEIEGKDPKPAQLKELIEHAKQKNIKVIFVQPQFSAKSANLVAKEIAGEVAFVDPLAENWSANLREVASRFKKALR